MSITFSNPTLSRVIPDYPLGGSKRGEMRVWVESDPKKGQRVVRQSTGKPKNNTYGDRVCIVDGSDGRTYILSLSKHGGMITVSRLDFMSANVLTDEWGGQTSSTFSPSDTYNELLTLINEVQV